ncbi:MAG: acetylornithine/succinylornithine family transaminase [Ruminococcaceae bacterium]|nr:acetylornithine/succinylornithine family transaminase [Oscillospiraceae bacterium]
MSNLQQLDKTYVANTYARFPVEITHGKGSEVYDTNGKRYIDMGSGIGVTGFGIADDIWQKAVCDQLSKVQHMSNLYYTEPCAKLAELLCLRTGYKKVFFSNSGAEANECAIKVARKYIADRKGEEYNTIITLKNSFHGRTITTLAATGQDVFHKSFKPLTPGFVHAPAGELDAIKELTKQYKVAAIMIECVQGEGGVVSLDPDYVKDLAAFAKENDILLICDEVQTGNGRTGKLYGYMHYGITPDIVSTAKGLGGGLPLGATLLSEKVQYTLGYGDHGSTFGGNPVCCAGALSILERMDDHFLSEVEEKSRYIFRELQAAPGIESVSGLGLMIGIQTKAPAKEVLLKCMEKGVLCLTAKTKLRLLPALNIPMEVLQEAINVIKTVCAEMEETIC